MMGAELFLLFFKKNSNSYNFTNQDIGKQTALFLSALLLQLTPGNAPVTPQTLQLLLRSITKVSPTCIIFNHFYFQQVKHWTLSIEKRAISIAFILIFDVMVINLSVIWWTFSPFDTLTFTNLYRPLSLHLNVNSKICVIRCSI